MRRNLLLSLLLCFISWGLSAQTTNQLLYQRAVEQQMAAGTFKGFRCADEILMENGVNPDLLRNESDACPETRAGYGTAGWNPSSSPQTNNADPKCSLPNDTRACNGGKIRIPIRNVIFECPNWNGENYLGGRGFARLSDIDLDDMYANINQYFAKANIELVEVSRERQVNCDMYDFYWAQWGPREPNDQFNDGTRDEKQLPPYDEDNVINIYWAGGFGDIHDCCNGVMAFLDKPPSERDYAVFRYAGAVNPSLGHHELSHYFGVYHTFWNINENTNQKTAYPDGRLDNSDCLTRGDGICDTWPDPNFEYSCSRDCRADGKDRHCYKTNDCAFDMQAYRCENGGALAINPSEGSVIDPFTSTVLQTNITTYNHSNCRNTFTPCQYFKLNTVAKSCRANLCFSDPATYFSSTSQYNKTINNGDPIPSFTAGRLYTSFDGSSYMVDCFDWFLHPNDRWSEAVTTGSNTFDPSPYVNGPGTYTFYLAEANALNNPPCKIEVKLTIRQGNCTNCPTCNDGIQNGNETGIDCGGDCAPCPVEPTCNDGIQNGNETGVDCGGDCAPCPVEPTCNDGIQNGNETGIDCGGNCAPCPVDCEVPSGFSVTSNTGRRATLNWNEVDGATNYTVEVRQAGGSNWRVVRANNNFLNISPLSAGTTYEWRVQSNCANGSSIFSPIQSFVAGATTPTCEDGIQNGDETGIDCGGSNCHACAMPTCDDGIQNGDEMGVDCGGQSCPACPVGCASPTGLFISDDQGTQVILNWEAVPTANSYRAEVRPKGTDRWKGGNSNTNSLRARPLSPGTTYEWRVRANCTGEQSDWSTIHEFVAGAASTQAVVNRSTLFSNQLTVEVFPSPTSDFINIKANQPIDRIELIDLMGRVHRAFIPTDTDTQIQLNVANLNQGQFFLRIQAGQEIETLRFVKE